MQVQKQNINATNSNVVELKKFAKNHDEKVKDSKKDKAA